jgi:cytochrome c-type biogenesis protein CcmH/NrfG
MSTRFGDHGLEATRWRLLGEALAARGDRMRALAALRNAARLDGNCAHVQRALGNLLFDSGQCDLALRCFERVSGR